MVFLLIDDWVYLMLLLYHLFCWNKEYNLLRVLGAFVGAGAPSNEPTSPPGSSRSPSIRDCLMKIRFLTLTPQQFAEGPAVSNLLTQSEKFAILMNISSPSTDVGMPPGFSKSVAQRRFLDDEVHYNIGNQRISICTFVYIF